MSARNKVLCLVLSVLITLAGCKSSKIIIKIKPDGSGTVVYDVNFDRATREQREKLQARLASGNFSFDFQEEKFRPFFPEPHFTIKEYKFNTEKLILHVELTFTDINRLLVAKNAKLLDINGLDFTTVKDNLKFSFKSKAAAGMEAMVRKGEKFAPMIREVIITRGKFRDKVRFYEEKDPNMVESVQEDTLKVKGHMIKRKHIKYNFAGYPEIKLNSKIRQAELSLHRTGRSDWSELQIDAEAVIPQDKDVTYVSWSNPVLLSGKYIPKQETELTNNFKNISRSFINSFSLQPMPDHFILPLKFKFPSSKATGISNSVIRIKALRANGIKQYKLGQIKPETQYEAAGITFTSGKTKKNQLDFSIRGECVRIKDFIFLTRNDSRFILDQSSSSFDAGRGRVSLRTIMPLTEGVVYVELYEPVDYAWLDVAVGAIDFENPKVEAAMSADNTVYKNEITNELNEKIEGFGKDVFASNDKMTAFFKSVPDEKIVAAIIQVVDSGYMPDTGNNQRLWYQNILHNEFQNRKEYVTANKKKIAAKLFSLQMYLPSSKKNLITYPLAGIRPGREFRDKIVAAVGQGHYELVNSANFQEGITSYERKALTKSFYNAPYIHASAILNILLSEKSFDRAFAGKVLNDESLNQNLRSQALEAILNLDDFDDMSFVKPYIEDSKMRYSVLQKISSKMNSNWQNKSAEEKQRLSKPILGVLTDLAAHPNSSQKDAEKILKKIRG